MHLCVQLCTFAHIQGHVSVLVPLDAGHRCACRQGGGHVCGQHVCLGGAAYQALGQNHNQITGQSCPLLTCCTPQTQGAVGSAGLAEMQTLGSSQA